MQDADFGDLSETVFFPEEFDVSEFGNQSMPSVIWSSSGNVEFELFQLFPKSIGRELVESSKPNFISLSNH